MNKFYTSLFVFSLVISFSNVFPIYGKDFNLVSPFIAQSVKPITAEDYFYRGLAFYENESYENALIDFSKALNIEESIVTIYYRASTYYYLSQYNESLTDANRGLVLSPNDPDFYFIRGLANYGLEKKQDAINDLQKAITLYEKLNNKEINYQEIINEIKKIIGRIRATM